MALRTEARWLSRDCVQAEWRCESAVAKRQRFQREISRGRDGAQKAPGQHRIDGEIVAFDQEGRPSFNALQNYGSAAAPVVYYVFDVLVLSGKDLRREKKLLSKLPEPVRYSAPLDAELPLLIQSVKVHGFEGLVAKRRDSAYEPGR